jgi:hypothetical protein
MRRLELTPFSPAEMVKNEASVSGQLWVWGGFPDIFLACSEAAALNVYPGRERYRLDSCTEAIPVTDLARSDFRWLRPPTCAFQPLRPI